MESLSLIWTIARKELRSYFNSPIAYIFLSVFLVLPAYFFFRGYFFIKVVDVRGYLDTVSTVFLFLVPAITMRTWAEEKKSGTIELLLTMPIKDYEIVFAKFLSSFLFLTIGLIFSVCVPLIVMYTGPLDWGVIASTYLGLLLLGGAYLSLGLFISALTDNQIIAFILSMVVCFVFYLIGQVGFLVTMPGFLSPVFRFLGLSPHYASLARGVIDSRDVIYYLSFTGYFLYLNVRYIAGRRFQ
ncbi:MAG: ABC transporter permease [Candidatus Gracilibacteria bacterium]|nr:ABC transporter permease [Candidatus Gracilibacteria bacterium]